MYSKHFESNFCLYNTLNTVVKHKLTILFSVLFVGTMIPALGGIGRDQPFFRLSQVSVQLMWFLGSPHFFDNKCIYFSLN